MQAAYLILLTLIYISQSKLAQYHFSENFGQVFHDYSSNQNSAVNGDSNLTTSHDTIPLDRGAYFSDKIFPLSSYISLPANEIVHQSFSVSPALYLSFWVFFGESAQTEDFSVINRFSAEDEFLLQLNKTQNNDLVCQVRTKDFDSGPIFANSAVVNYQWVFILLGVAGKTLEVYLNEPLVISTTLQSDYSESSTGSLIIGHSSASFKGILFEFSVHESKTTPGNLISLEYHTGNCLLHDCPEFCYPSLISGFRQYCLPDHRNFEADAQGHFCERMTGEGPWYGCYKRISLVCDCEDKSCVLSHKKVTCWCTGKDCACPVQKTFNGELCAACNLDCSSCKDNRWCDSCVAKNASPSLVEGCECNLGFFNRSRLNETGACLKCGEDCRSCKESGVCESCKDRNSEPGGEGCKCKKGFFRGDGGVCVACEESCATCERLGECLSCKDSNAIVNKGECICGPKYYNLSALNTEGTCLLCNSDCLSCKVDGTCTYCKSSNAIKIGTHGCKCESGYYNTSALLQSDSCRKCSEDCLSCVDEFKCEKCFDPNAEPGHIHGCVCKNNFFNITKIDHNGACLHCNSDCKTCESHDLCTSCKDENALSHNIQGCVCKPDFFNKSLLSHNGACKICHFSCERCGSDFDCLDCKSQNAIVVDPINGCGCMQGFFNISLLTSKDSCEPCNQDCKTCTNSSSCATCLALNAFPSQSGCKCSDSYFNSTPLTYPSACQKCEPSCQICISNETCLTCISQNASPFNSICTCDKGFFNTSDLTQHDSCLPCHPDCETCDSASTCLTCKDPNTIPATLGCSCKKGFFSLSNAISRCSVCEEDCEECNSLGKCLVCKSENSRPSDLGCKCEVGFFNESLLVGKDSCKRCEKDCFSCVREGKCEKCLDLYADPGYGGCKCFEGFYNSSGLRDGGECMACNRDCSQCDDNRTCIVCKAANAHPSDYGCLCNEGYHNISSLIYPDSCINIDLYSITLVPNTSYPTAFFPFTLTVQLLNKLNLPSQSTINFTLFSYSDDLYSDTDLTVQTKNGSAVFLVYCKYATSNSFGVIIGPITGTTSVIVMPQALKIHSISPMPKYQNDDFQVEIGVYNFEKSQLASMHEDFWIRAELNPSGKLFGDAKTRPQNGIALFSGLRIGSIGIFKLQIKADMKESASSSAIEIIKDPNVTIKAEIDPKILNFGFEFFVNVSVVDRLGRLLGDERTVELMFNKKIEGESVKNTLGSKAEFLIRCLEVGELEIFVKASEISRNLTANVKKNWLDVKIDKELVRNIQNKAAGQEFGIDVRVMDKKGGRVEDYFGRYNLSLEVEPFGRIKCRQEVVETVNGTGRFEQCRVLDSGLITIKIFSEFTEANVIGPLDFARFYNCKHVTEPASISIAIVLVAFIFSGIFYLADRKKRLIESSVLSYIDLVNVISLFKPRASIERVSSVFKLASSCLVILTAVGLTYFDFKFKLTSQSDISRGIFSLVISQTISIANIFLLIRKSSPNVHKHTVFLNFSICSIAVVTISLICTIVCVESVEKWIMISVISCCIECCVLQPLVSFVAFFCCKNKEKAIRFNENDLKEMSPDSFPLNKPKKSVTEAAHKHIHQA